MRKIIILSGGFDPIHKGHIKMFRSSEKIGSVFVGLNSDDWLIRKKGRFFMSLNERKTIIENLIMVDQAFSFNDNDDTANDAISLVIKNSSKEDKIIFANGGDRNKTNIPEIDKFRN